MFLNTKNPRKICYVQDKDFEYGGGLKFHHIFGSYKEYHCHDFFEFVICFQGQYNHVVNGIPYTLRKLDCAFLYPEDAHALEDVTGTSSHYSISFKADYFTNIAKTLDNSFFERYKQRDPHLFSLSEARLKKIVFFLSQIKSSEKDLYNLQPLISYLLANLLEPLFTQTEAISQNNRSKWLNDLLMEMNKPDNLCWDVSDVVNHTNYSKTHLSRLFKEYTNESIGEYLQAVKLSNARDILVNSEMSITELCDVIGHSSLSHFSSVFKKAYGMSPGKYRQKYKPKE